MTEALVIGECMVELGLEEGGRAALGYAGDTFNTAVYLSRLGVRAAYATALGRDDPFSAGILALMAAEGLDARHVVQAPGRLPGLYAIQRDERGERSFFYWRGEAPARDLMALADLAALGEAMAEAQLVYVSAITLAVLGEAGRAVLIPMLAKAARAGAGVALDTNYRARLWAGADEALAAMDELAPVCRWISMSTADAPDAEARAARWAAAGAEVVLRQEDRRIEHLQGAARQVFAPGPQIEVVDTTGAGDSFNAAFLAARLAGKDAEEAIGAGRLLAETVVRYKGAIIPREAMSKERP